MNTPSPLVPQGATPPRGKSSLYFKVLMIVTVHVVVIGGMLLQGCKDTTTKDTTGNNGPALNPGDTTLGATNLAPAPAAPMAEVPTTLNPNISNTVAGATVTPGTPGPQVPPPMAVEAPKAPEAAPVPAVGEKEYVVVQGDRLSSIAKRNGISLKALMEANPGIDPRKLQINQKLQIPASMTATVPTSGAGATPAAGENSVAAEGGLYTVKPGDVLLRIARTHGTTVKKIMALNDLKTTSIRVNQRLKLPAANAASPAPATAPVAIPTASAPMTRVSAATPTVAAN